jgi:lipopolysaccharide exporter
VAGGGPVSSAGTPGGSGDLGSRIRRGFVWSALGNASLRLASLVTGIVLARLLAPEDFGVYAVALMVQSILINLAELGLAADLVRHGDLVGRGPTITAVALVTSTLLALLMWTTAGVVAGAMGAPDAAGAIRVMALTIPLAGLTVVPYAQLQREFRQSRLFTIDVSNMALSTTLTILLAVGGWGAMALAVGRLAGQVLATGMQFGATRQRLRLGWRPEVARTGIRFGLPLALAGLLAWTLLNVDTVLVGRYAGVTALGFYVLAFNISSWPTSVIGTAVRAVAFPAFSQRSLESGERDTAGAVRATSLVWGAAVPVAASLALLAAPVVELLYGSRWLSAAPVLTALAVFGALRVLFDLWVAYFTACGAAATLLTTQLAWLATLVPAMWFAVRDGDIERAGWAHAVVAVAIMLPVHLWRMSGCGVPTRALVRVLVPALVAIAPAALAGRWAAQLAEPAVAQLLLGGGALCATYAALLGIVLKVLARRRAPTPQSVPEEVSIA